MTPHPSTHSQAVAQLGTALGQELEAEDFVRLNQLSPWRMLTIGSRLRSRDVLEYLARRATGDALGWDQLLTTVERPGGLDDLPQGDARCLVSAALLATVLDATPRHFAAASTVMHALGGAAKLWTEPAASALRLATQVAVTTDSHALFTELARLPFQAPGVAWAGRTDFLRPRTPAEWGHAVADGAGARTARRGSTQFDRWWAAFNAPFTERGLAPYRLRPERIADATRLFEAIEEPEVAPAATPPDEQPLVTVIVPTYCPEASFLNTIASLTRQSWTKLEVLIVDDCSPSGAEHLAAAEASDPRVRVIRMPRNGGAYRARNAGLAAAQGEFVSFLDADDISHTQRIELQLAPLLADPRLIASMSQSQRVLSDGTITYFGFLPHRLNASSLLFRRAPVLARLGQYDAVRKGADSEFTERLISAFGPESMTVLPEPLSLVQLTLGSLSRSDFRPDWMTGNRLAYMRQFRAAHRRIAAQAKPDWCLTESRPAVCRSSPGMRGETPRERIAAAVVSDWNGAFAAPRGDVAWLRTLAPTTGEPVGLLNGLRPRFSVLRRALIAPELADAVERDEAAWMNWSDPTLVGTLIFDHPELLWALPQAADLSVRAERVEIVLDEFMRRADAAALPPISWCEERVRERFGLRPVWRTSSAALLTQLRNRGSAVEPLASGANAPAPAARAASPARPTLALVWPARVDRRTWNAAAVRAMLPDPALVETLVYDETGALDEWVVAELGLPLRRRESHTRAELLREAELLIPDLFGERLLAAESWLRSAATAGVQSLLPHGLETMYDGQVLRYPPGAAREVLTAVALDPSYTPYPGPLNARGGEHGR